MPLETCPNCQAAMQHFRRSDVQVDICPSCQGVWLDRGELERLLTPARHAYEDWNRHRRRDDDEEDEEDHPRHREWRNEHPQSLQPAPPVDEKYRVPAERREEKSFIGALERILRALD